MELEIPHVLSHVNNGQSTNFSDKKQLWKNEENNRTNELT